MVTEYTKRVITIITSGQLIAANQIAKGIDPIGGEFAWYVGLSPSGNPPATHYWNDWQMTPEQMAILKQDLDDGIPGYFQWFELSHWDPSFAEPFPEEVLELSIPPLEVIESD